MKINTMLLTDFYKTIHHFAYVEGMDYLVSYWTPRMSRIEGIDKVVMFGLQAFMKKYLIEEFNENFFKRPKEEVMSEYRRLIANTMTEQAADTKHLEDLHNLGYLPIQIKAVEEGTRVNIKTPMFEISNTVKGYGWLVNYIETLVSVNVWHPMTSATIAYRFREIVEEYFDKTVSDKSSVIVEPTQAGLKERLIRGFVGLNAVRSSACGDFSMRGMTMPESAMASGAAHLLSFTGTATIPAIVWLEEYYNADCTKEVVGRGVPSTEHSVMSSYGREGEFESYRRLITEAFPKGPLSIVSDTYDYWNVLTNYVPKLKEEILARDGKVIIRGDCYDDQTEVLTQSGWKLFKDIIKGKDKVAQWDDKRIEFVTPLGYIDKEYKGKMIRFSNIKNHLDILVTPNHRMLGITVRGNYLVKAAQDYKPTSNKLPVSGYKKGTISNLTYFDRLMIAFQADGRCRGLNKKEQFESGYTLEFGFSKKRKLNRLIEICKKGGFKYKLVKEKARQFSEKSNNWNDQVTVYVKIYKKPYKYFEEWVDIENVSYTWCNQFIDEVAQWDGNIRENNYITFENTSRRDVELVQTIAVLSGNKTTFSIREDNRKQNYNTIYRVFIDSQRDYIGGQSIQKDEVDYEGRIYCVTVPSSFLILRRKGQIFISGNSGHPVDIICGEVDIEKENIFESVEEATSDFKDIAWDYFRENCDEEGYCDYTEYFCKVKDKYYKVKCSAEITSERGGYTDNDYYVVDSVSVELEEIELTPAQKGTVELLWETFGGYINDKGYKVLDPHIGAIYGDSITLERAAAIYERLERKGFAVSNCTLGIGSYGYLGLLSRDSLGFALKATHSIIEGDERQIYKDPITDTGNFKKSQRGMCYVYQEGEDILYKDELSLLDLECNPELRDNLLQPVLRDGKLLKDYSLSEIRERLHKGKF